MANRTIKLKGAAFSSDGTDITLTINMNNSQVYSGTVSATAGTYPTAQSDSISIVEVCSWTLSTSVTGAVPVSIAVSGGTFVFEDLIGNYVNGEVAHNDPDPSGSDYMIDSDGYYVWSVDPSVNFDILNENSVSSDGKTNISYTNAPDDWIVPSRNPVTEAEQQGEWRYPIPDGATLSFDFQIDASKTVVSWLATDSDPTNNDHP
jgi:hypothetical protein